MGLLLATFVVLSLAAAAQAVPRNGTNCMLTACSASACNALFVLEATGPGANFITINIGSNTNLSVSSCASLQGPSAPPFLVSFVFSNATGSIANVSITVKDTVQVAPRVLIEAALITNMSIVFERISVDVPLAHSGSPRTEDDTETNNGLLLRQSYVALFGDPSFVGGQLALIAVVGNALSSLVEDVTNLSVAIRRSQFVSRDGVFANVVYVAHNTTSRNLAIVIEGCDIVISGGGRDALLRLVGSAAPVRLINADMSVVASRLVSTQFGRNGQQACLLETVRHTDVSLFRIVVSAGTEIHCQQIRNRNIHRIIGNSPWYRVVYFYSHVNLDTPRCGIPDVMSNVSFIVLNSNVTIESARLRLEDVLAASQASLAMDLMDAAVIVVQGILVGGCIRITLLNFTMIAFNSSLTVLSDASSMVLETSGVRITDRAFILMERCNVNLSMEGSIMPYFVNSTAAKVVQLSWNVTRSNIRFLDCSITMVSPPGVIPSVVVDSQGFRQAAALWDAQVVLQRPMQSSPSQPASFLRLLTCTVISVDSLYSSNLTLAGLRVTQIFARSTLYKPLQAFSTEMPVFFNIVGSAVMINSRSAVAPDEADVRPATVSVVDCSLQAEVDILAVDPVKEASLLFPVPLCTPVMVSLSVVYFASGISPLGSRVSMVLLRTALALNWSDASHRQNTDAVGQWKSVTHVLAPLLYLPAVSTVVFPLTASILSLYTAIGLPPLISPELLSSIPAFSAGVATVSNCLINGSHINMTLTTALSDGFAMRSVGQVAPTVIVVLLILPNTMDSCAFTYSDVRVFTPGDLQHLVTKNLFAVDAGRTVVTGSSLEFDRVNAFPTNVDGLFAVDACFNFSLTVPYQQRACRLALDEWSTLAIRRSVFSVPAGNANRSDAVVIAVAAEDNTARIDFRWNAVIGATSLFAPSLLPQWASLNATEPMFSMWCNGVAAASSGTPPSVVSSFTELYAVAHDMSPSFAGLPTAVVQRSNAAGKEAGCPMQAVLAAKVLHRPTASAMVGAAWIASSAAAALFVSMAAPLSLGRQVGLVAMAACSTVEDAADQPLDVFSSPTQLSVGAAGGGSARGAVVGNAVIVWGAFAAAGYVAVLAVVRRKFVACVLAADYGGALKAFVQTAGAGFGLPGATVTVVAPLLQATVQASVLLLRLNSSAADVATGVAGLLLCCGICAKYSHVVLRGVRAIAPKAVRHPEYLDKLPLLHSAGASKLTLSRLTVRYFTGEASQWDRSSSCYQHYGALYATTRPQRYWWFVAELALSVALGVLGGLFPPTTVGCLADMWSATALCCVHLVAAVTLMPMNCRFDQLGLVVTSAANVVIAVAVSAAQGEPNSAVDALTLALGFATVATMLLSLPVAVLRRWLGADTSDLIQASRGSKRRLVTSVMSTPSNAALCCLVFLAVARQGHERVDDLRNSAHLESTTF